jgi:hypothetical protein
MPFIYKNVVNLTDCFSIQTRAAAYAGDRSAIQRIFEEPTEDLERYLEYAKSVDKNRAAIEAGTEKFVGE